ncbi:MAG: restriction endonuclease subunit S [Balneolia bacterium]|nr:restriction endonuclease subunit S [Balneolia bacterium]
MSEKNLIPELRFPEFEDDGVWDMEVFEDVFDRRTNKNVENNQNVLTISAQLGLVSQLEYFNKKISSKDVTGYYLLHKGDFAYNKSYSKGYPMGAIKPLKFYEKGVVSTLYICFRAKDGYNPSFFEQYFDAGLLNSEISNIAQEGGRAHGLLNVSVKEFFRDINLLVPKPQEQQKIASCLSSLDELIAAHNDKLNALKDHKKGLLQNLFPQEGETMPKLRFPEYEGDGEWVEHSIGSIAKVSAGGTPTSTEQKYWGGKIPWMSSGELNLKRVYSVEKTITELGLKESSTKMIPSSCVLIGLAGQGKTRGTAAINNIELCTNQSIAAIHPNQKKFDSEFLFHKIDSMYKTLRRLSTGQGGRGGLNLSIIKEIVIHLPSLNEQQKISSCLSAVDELITAQQEKIEQLKQHKKGLMQGLFPKIES